MIKLSFLLLVIFLQFPSVTANYYLPGISCDCLIYGNCPSSPSTYIDGNCCDYNRHFTCEWCACKFNYNEDCNKPSCSNGCYVLSGTSATWWHGGTAVCRSSGWSCVYQYNTCLASDCCDVGCTASGGCWATPNGNNCASRTGFTKTCTKDCKCNYAACDACSPSGAVQYQCSGNMVQKRTCGDFNNDLCLEWSSWNNVENCNSHDGCYSGYYRDYYCSGGSCKYSSSCTESCCDAYYGNSNAYCSGGTCYPPTTTTSTSSTTTTSTTTTTLPSACGNTICEYSRSETQDNCPQDCKTTFQLYSGTTPILPSTYLRPNQAITVILSFNDSRYNSTQGFNMMLNATIDDQIFWSEADGCKVCGKKLSEMGCSNCGMSGKMGGTGNHWSGQDHGYEIDAYMENGYGRMKFNATLPSTIAAGVHTLKVTPILFSFPITLKAAEVQISIADGLYTFIMAIKNLFNRITGLIVYPLN